MSGLQEFPLVGREQQLRQIAASNVDVIAGNARITAILGQSGSGKSRLIAEVERDAEQRSLVSVVGRCREESDAPPYWPWSEIFLELENATETATTSPLANLETSGGEFDGQDSRFTVWRESADGLKRLSDEKPLLLVFDDLQWADASTLQFLQYLATNIASSRIHVFLAWRDEEHPRSERFNPVISGLA